MSSHLARHSFISEMGLDTFPIAFGPEELGVPPLDGDGVSNESILLWRNLMALSRLPAFHIPLACSKTIASDGLQASALRTAAVLRESAPATRAALANFNRIFPCAYTEKFSDSNPTYLLDDQIGRQEI